MHRAELRRLAALGPDRPGPADGAGPGPAVAPAAPEAPEAPATAETPATPEAPAPAPASVAVERRVEWSDTDAAGHYHFSAVQRWAEAAEAELLRRLGLADLFGRIPRVHFEADYRERLWFGDVVRTELRVDRVGGSSLHYAFEVHGPHGLAASGRMSVVHAAPHAEGAAPWPAPVRRALAEAGPQRSEVQRPEVLR
ncbi:acyl-CoA thioesterase [Kitasatospora sp. NBC_01560]|uniref:acyl-CoA thioesterase n=1 Tax=Kitasatospora sp. NBC_01560 TaxID=2975965 RepID=UPI003870A40A